MTDNYNNDAESFANVLIRTKLLDSSVFFGNFALKVSNGVNSKIQYNEEGIDLLCNSHEYTVNLIDGCLQFSLQLYENLNSHFRLFAFTRLGNIQGMTFSVNLTTEKESENIIFLTQKVKFAERYDGNSKIAQEHRRQKQIVMSQLLRKLGLDVTENNDLILGIFDPITKSFVNTSAEKFLNDFIAVSLIKGHFQGNKGYELDLLPSFKIDDENLSVENKVEQLPKKFSEQLGKRSIPLSLRYKVFKRDNCRCVVCGRSAKDGIILHVDHKIPYSLGGLTEINNLRTLCQDCNIGKSNKFIDE